jgi:hypothetical protein
MLPGEELGVGGIALYGLGQGGERGVALFVLPGVWARVNGEPVLGGLRLLGHRDEILVEDARLFFSLELTPEVTVFRLVAGERAPTCPVCRGPVKDENEAVRCPGCGRWFHQAAARSCWTYAPACRFCDHPTPLTGAAAWRPELEEAGV